MGNCIIWASLGTFAALAHILAGVNIGAFVAHAVACELQEFWQAFPIHLRAVIPVTML